MLKKRLITNGNMVVFSIILSIFIVFAVTADPAHARVSLTDLQNQITALQAQVAALQAQIAAMPDGHSLDAADGNPVDAVYVDNIGNVEIGHGRLFGYGVNDTFSYDGKSMGHYTISWQSDSWFGWGSTAWMSGYGGIKFFTGGFSTSSPPRPSMTLGYWGDLYVATNITAGGTKGFLIPHPIEADSDLVHAAVEGPEAAVFYRGEAQLVDGSVAISLPDYFEALTRMEDRTVKLTCKNGWSALYVDGEIADGLLTVKTTAEGNPSQAFYWEVKAVRADVDPLDVVIPHVDP